MDPYLTTQATEVAWLDTVVQGQSVSMYSWADSQHVLELRESRHQLGKSSSWNILLLFY